MTQSNSFQARSTDKGSNVKESHQKVSTLAPFHVTIFRNLWLSTRSSNLGNLIQVVGASWLMMSLTTSSTLVSLVQAANTLPIVFLSLMAGALADNFNRRTIMFYAQLFRMIASVFLAIITLAGWISPLHLLIFTFLIGGFGALFNPPWQATVSDIVPREQIAAAVTLNSVGFNLMRSVGPAIGGMIVAAWGASAAFVINAVSYFPLLGVLFFWKPNYKQNTLPRERLVGAMSDGVRYVMMSPHIVSILVRAFLFGIGSISIQALLPLVARDQLGGGAMVYGSLLGFFGLGAIFAGIINSWVRSHFKGEMIVTISFLGFAFSCIGLGLSHSLIISHLILLPAGMSWVFALALFNTNVQLSAPRWVLSRALALYQTAAFGGMALGSWIWGSFADGYNTKIALFICATFLLFGALAGFKFRIFEVSTKNPQPQDPLQIPDAKLDLKPDDGPILITIQYQIDPKKLHHFFKLMVIRRAHKISVGARSWALLRNIEKPDCWIESYHMATWVDYLRDNQRQDEKDIQLSALLRKLNNTPNDVHIDRMIEHHKIPQDYAKEIKAFIEPTL